MAEAIKLRPFCMPGKGMICQLRVFSALSSCLSAFNLFFLFFFVYFFHISCRIILMILPVRQSHLQFRKSESESHSAVRGTIFVYRSVENNYLYLMNWLFENKCVADFITAVISATD